MTIINNIIISNNNRRRQLRFLQLRKLRSLADQNRESIRPPAIGSGQLDTADWEQKLADGPPDRFLPLVEKRLRDRRTIPKVAFCQNASLTMADEVLEQFVGFDRIPW